MNKIEQILLLIALAMSTILDWKIFGQIEQLKKENILLNKQCDSLKIKTDRCIKSVGNYLPIPVNKIDTFIIVKKLNN